MKMILAGKPVAQNLYKELINDISKLKRDDIHFSMAAILVGEDLASLKYVQIKEKTTQKLGIGFELFCLPSITRESEVRRLISDLNDNKYIAGIVVQLPLPKDFKTEEIIKLISSKKDIDGFSGEYNAPTAQAIWEILKFYKIPIQGKKIVIVGHGRLVGAPLEKFLVKHGHQVKVCDSQTADLGKETLAADILVSAAGVPGLIKPDMVKSSAVVVDAGTSEARGQLVGDVDPEVYKNVYAYTPTPGGVGPVTVACLMKNLIEAAKRQIK